MSYYKGRRVSALFAAASEGDDRGRSTERWVMANRGTSGPAQERLSLEREAGSQVSTRSSKSSKMPGSVALTREKEGAGDLSVETPGVVTRARKRRMVQTSGVRNIQKEVKTS